MTNIEEIIDDEVEAYNDMIGKLKDYDCELCKNRGYVAEKKYIRGQPYRVIKECSCLNKRKVLQEKNASNLGELLKTHTFESYIAEQNWQKTTKIRAISFAKDNNTRFFYIGGHSGTGKTHICLAIINELFNSNKKCKMVFWNDLTTKIKQNKFNEVQYNKILNEIINAEVLFIDDFFKITPDKDDFDIAFKIINARYNLSQAIDIKTIISSEYSFGRLVNLDEALASRIFQYCNKDEYFISFESDNIKNQRF